MAAATSGTPTSSRIPLDVIHGNQEANSRYSTFQSGASNGCHSAFEMGSMNDETDRIKQRMKEFEDRCKRWREDFFAKERHQQQQQQPASMPDPPLSFTDLNNNNCCSAALSHMSGVASGASSIPFTSTLHKSYIEDTADGGKKYKIEFDIGDFNQNELQISTNGRALTVKGTEGVYSWL